MKTRRTNRLALTVLLLAGAMVALPATAFAHGRSGSTRFQAQRHRAPPQITQTARAVPNHQLAEFPFEQRRARLADGRFVQRYRNGNVAVQGRIVRGQPHGTWTRYFASGQRAEVRTYDRGTPTGTWRAFHANGRKAWEVSYRGGVRHGAFTAWHPNGRTAERQRYVNGRTVGPRLAWSAAGRPVRG
jgi:hypothetical protein